MKQTLNAWAIEKNSMPARIAFLNKKTSFLLLFALMSVMSLFAKSPTTYGTIGDRVWFDNNANGIQDAGEIGISGVTVKLRNSSGTVISTTTTNSSGNYLFSSVPAPANYSVEFPLSISVGTLTTALVGSNTAVDSDPNVSTGITASFSLVVGQDITSIDAGYTTNNPPPPSNCSCTNSTNNLLTNGSFENGSTGWTVTGGSLTTGTGYVMCGAANGFLNWSSGTAKMYQDVNLTEGTTVTLNGYSGTHTPGISCSPKLSLIFLNSSNVVITQLDVVVTKDVDVTGSVLSLYTITGTAPVGTAKVRVQGSIGCNTLKVDAFCLIQTTTPPPPNFCTTCLLGYPDNSNLPKSAVTFSENEVLAAMEPSPAGCGILDAGFIKVWYSDEHALLLGVRSVVVKRANGTSYTTNYPITAYSGTPSCASNPLLGTTIASGAQSGNDVAAGGGRPIRPIMYITDLTVNGATSRIGDWQQGGTGFNPSSVCGSWKGGVRNVDSTKNPVLVTVQPDGDPSSNGWNLGGGDAPPAGTPNLGFGALVKWDVSTLGLLAGHVYRIQVMVHDGDQNKTGGDAGSMCATIYVPAVLNPDINVTYVNVPVPGNVQTNDKVPSGTTYGTPTPVAGNPASGVITMNSDGTYTFVSPNVGVYLYRVPVCVPGQSAPCPTTLLTITVLGPTITTNPPVANTDIAYTKVNTPVTLNSLANDRAGNPGGSLNPASVTVTIAPLHGTTTVNTANGAITYTPATGYVGTDTLTYRVCDNSTPTALCATAKQIITIKSSGAANSTLAADDYAYTPLNVPVTGNVKTNDTDPEGNTQTVATQTTTVAGKGTLVLAADGSYTFTPVTGYSGPVSFPYTTCDNGTPQACASATLYILVQPAPVYNPDFNVTYVNVPVPGNVNTNDIVPVGTTYGTSPALLSSPAGSSYTLTMNSNGTYTFTGNTVGVYTFNVPVCVPGQPAPCPNSLLTITVLGPYINNNPPVANTDIASTKINTPVTLKTLANDRAGNANRSLVPSSVTVTTAPLHGTTSVNAATGDITYTPAAGYVGNDTLTYRVCDNNTPPLCATAKQIITIKSSTAPNSTLAADDYASTAVNIAVSGNVKTNDTDPEGNTQTVATQTTTAAGKGTLVLAADGSYTFTPVIGFTGPVSFPYTTCDNGTPQACASATLYILVSPPPPVLNPDVNVTYVNVPVPGNVNTNDVVPAGSTYGTPVPVAGNPAGGSITMNSNGTYTFVSPNVGVYVYNVPVCVPTQTPPCPTTLLTITVLGPNIINPPVANTDIATTKVNTPVTLNSLINDRAGNVGGSLNPNSITVTVAPLHGTTTTNPATGEVTYTPAAGFTGMDTLTYNICDNGTPALCATAKQIITIQSNPVNTTLAADDYASTPVNVAVTGNVKTNDTDPEGNAQTVTAQTTTLAGKGTLVLNTDGTFTFTPVVGYSGPANFPYTTCDNGTPQACASATLYILVQPAPLVPDLTPSIFNDGTTLLQNSSRDNVIRIFNIGNGPTSGPIVFTIPKMLPAFEITIDSRAIFSDVFGGITLDNANWIIVEQATRYVITSAPGVVIPGGGGFVDLAVKVKAIGIKTSTANLSVQIIFGTGGGETPINNNADNNTYSTN